MKNFLIAMSFYLLAPWASAGQPLNGSATPTIPIKSVPDGPRIDRILKPSEMNAEHRKMIWQDKTLDKDGYLRVKSSIEYLDLPSAFLKHPKFAKASDASRLATARGDVETIGKLNEDQNRVSWAFTHGNTNLLFTVWDYKNAGAVFSVPEELINQKVNGRPAILSLSYADKSDKALWKLVWWNNGTMYELYASDYLDRGRAPQNKPQNILHIADLAINRIGKQ